MCGIAGSTNDRRGASSAAMAVAMAHRGPDDEGVYVDPNARLSLAARRLSVIDVAGGHQPVHSEDESIWAALNGEIYNHPGLRQQLQRRGHSFASHTDTEVLVHLYEEYGDALVHAIEGMYAFAIWDRNRRELLIARDRFGEKPLFYATTPAGGLVFASELTALRAGLEADPEIDPASLDSFFVLGYVPGERTIFRSVLQLPPAHLLRWSMDKRELQVRSYWSLPARPQSRPEPVSALAQEAAELLRASVRSRLIADVPLGVFLSGGLDSTLVAALAAQECSVTLKTFTVAYDTGDVGEAEQARATARRIGSDHHEVILSASEIGDRVRAVLPALDQPNADPALVALHAVAEEARRSVTVAVGGEGADELFAGYPRYRWLQRATAAQHLLPSFLGGMAARAIRNTVPGRGAKFADVIRPTSLAERQLDWVTGGRRQARSDLYGPRLRHCLEADTALQDISRALVANGRADPVDQLMSLDMNRYLPDDVLAKADRATMLVSLEMRTPYLSRELAELSASIPTSIHLADGGKAILRQIARGLPAIADTRRAKKAFGVPMSEWLRGPLLPLLRAQAEEGALVREGWIDAHAFRATFHAHAEGRAEKSFTLWPLLAAGLWLDHLRGG